MAKVIDIFSRIPLKEEQVADDSKQELSLEEIERRNKANEERVRKERQSANKSVLRSNNMTPDKDRHW